MIRLLALLCCLVLPMPLSAQDFSGLARIDMAKSELRDEGRDVVLRLALSQTIPYRVFTLDEPRRLVVDFKEVDWTGVSRAALLNSDQITDLRFGTFQRGWSRLVLDLGAPLAVTTAGLATDDTTGTAALTIRLTPTDADRFAARAGAPPGAAWETAPAPLPDPAPDDGLVVVALDPGHGGIDPGADRGGVTEAPLMLQLAQEVAETLNRTGRVRAVLTREDDSFVPLDARMTRARAAGADLMISLHADALEEDEARGASVYTLDITGQNTAAQRMAERHDRGDLLAGLDLTAQDDRVAMALMDLARVETGPAADRFADMLVSALNITGARVNSNPRREARLAVLMAADFPSVLLEAGFLSSAADRATLTSAEGRGRIVTAITVAVLEWAADAEVRDPLKRR